MPNADVSGAPSTWRDAIYVSIWIPVLRDDFCHQLEGRHTNAYINMYIYICMCFDPNGSIFRHTLRSKNITIGKGLDLKI